MGDVGLSFVGDVAVFYWVHGVGARDSLGVWLGWVLAHPLTEAAELVGVGGVPSCLVLGVLAELAMLHGDP